MPDFYREHTGVGELNVKELHKGSAPDPSDRESIGLTCMIPPILPVGKGDTVNVVQRDILLNFIPKFNLCFECIGFSYHTPT